MLLQNEKQKDRSQSQVSPNSLGIQEMVQLTHRNHFQFGYDGKPFEDRTSPHQKWFVRYGRCEQKPLNFHDECLRTARTIRSKTQEPITVLFSGGVDSEVALRSFVEAGISVQAAILRFKNDLNIHDMSWAVIICDSLKVPYRIYDLDVLEFWQGEAWEYATRTSCVSPQLLTTMWLVDQVPGYVVLGSGECLLVKVRPKDYVPGVSPYEKSYWNLWEKEKIASWYRHFMKRNRSGCPGFFQYTPEIMLSYLLDPFVVKLASDQIIGKLTTESSKLAIYQQHFPLISRPKYTGFEKVQPEDAKLRAQLKNRFREFDEIYKTSYSELIAMLSPL